MTFAHVVIAVG